MILIKILPTAKRSSHKYFEVFFEEDLIEKRAIYKQKEIIRLFAIDKKEFEIVVRESLSGNRS
jgi:hypothetical protein